MNGFVEKINFFVLYIPLSTYSYESVGLATCWCVTDQEFMSACMPNISSLHETKATQNHFIKKKKKGLSTGLKHVFILVL